MEQIKIAGFVSNSFVDWPGKIASVIFLGGCNFACHYCHNHHILTADSNNMDFADALEQIKERKGFIDGVVLSGGEPTLHKDLTKIINEIKSLGLPIKLDTNGTDFTKLRKFVEEGMVEYVAMDVKAPLAKYKEIVKVDNTKTMEELGKSIEYLKNQDKVDYMFRMTLSPMLGDDDIAETAKLVKGAKCFQLQQYVPNSYSTSGGVVHLPHTKESAEKYAALLSKFVNKVVLRGF